MNKSASIDQLIPTVNMNKLIPNKNRKQLAVKSRQQSITTIKKEKMRGSMEQPGSRKPGRPSQMRNLDLYDHAGGSSSEEQPNELQRFQTMMQNVLKEDSDSEELFVYKGPQKALEMLSQDQINILRDSTTLDTNQSFEQPKQFRVKNDASSSALRLRPGDKINLLQNQSY